MKKQEIKEKLKGKTMDELLELLILGLQIEDLEKESKKN